MITKKKNPKVDLEKKRFAFFQIGLILAAALCLMAFEYTGIQFSDIEKQTAQEDISIIETPIPQELIQIEQPQKQRRQQQIINEVIEVEQLTPKETSKEVQHLEIDLANLQNLLTSGDEGGFSHDANRFDPTDNPGVMPEFPGGEAAMARWISQNINIPEYAYPMNGTVYVSFVVNKYGNIEDVKIGKGIDQVYDNAALAVVKRMPEWIPGEQFGKPVAVSYHLPIRIINR